MHKHPNRWQEVVIDEHLTVGDVGEFTLITRIAALLPTSADVLVGPGDDAAVVRAADGRVVVTTDVLVEGVHFRTDWSSAYDIGRKAAAQNLADVVVMGAQPTALVVALVIPASTPVAWAEDLARGLASESGRAGAVIVGGDIASGPVLVISVTAFGDLQGRPPVTRGGAQVGDAVVLAGAPGRSAAGLAVLGRDDANLVAAYDDLVAVHRAPRPRYDAALALASLGATAMIDTSDGLASELWHLARASGKRLKMASPPADSRLDACAQSLGTAAAAWVLGGGEDHAILATIPRHVLAESEKWAVQIGIVESGEGVVDSEQKPIPVTGWDHFEGAP